MATKGTLIIIGGREDKKNERVILKRVVKQCRGKLLVATVASDLPEEVWQDYREVFRDLGVSDRDLYHLNISSMDDARDPENIKLLDDASVIFFTGGDQLKITTRIGGTPINDRIIELHKLGATIAGTSAGASVMSATMLTGGDNDESHKIGNWQMAPGLGLTRKMLIDQHFAQRGRIGRLLGSVALNPGLLGIGIDEDTAIVVQDEGFEVIGTNAVYVVDGREVRKTNVTEAEKDKTMTIFGVKLHVMGHDDRFDFESRVPIVEDRKSDVSSSERDRDRDRERDRDRDADRGRDRRSDSQATSLQ